jgi:integrase
LLSRFAPTLRPPENGSDPLIFDGETKSELKIGVSVTNLKGGPRGYSAHAISKAFKRAGLKNFRIHDLRHTCASRLIQNGMSLYEVANILGHVDVQTTQRYAHLDRTNISQKARDIMEHVGIKNLYVQSPA